MTFTITSLAERPDRWPAVRDMVDSRPVFVTENLVGATFFPRIAAELPAYVLYAEDEDGEVVATAHSVPFALHAPGRGDLPARRCG
ncbi:hypothetical protein [Streptomyces sp. R02]|uniref:GNAT family N-acetyltransferase n=1 Tax=Streptomyces sp. R02 TaxID=3238623 RepID=A0AB39LKJ1_9ACTN